MTFLDRLTRAFAPTASAGAAAGAFLELKMPVFEPAADAVPRRVEEDPEPSATAGSADAPMIEPTSLTVGVDFAAGEELDMEMELGTLEWGAAEPSASVDVGSGTAAPEQYGSIDLGVEISLDDATHERAA